MRGVYSTCCQALYSVSGGREETQERVTDYKVNFTGANIKVFSSQMLQTLRAMLAQIRTINMCRKNLLSIISYFPAIHFDHSRVLKVCQSTSSLRLFLSLYKIENQKQPQIAKPANSFVVAAFPRQRK